MGYDLACLSAKSQMASARLSAANGCIDTLAETVGGMICILQGLWVGHCTGRGDCSWTDEVQCIDMGLWRMPVSMERRSMAMLAFNASQ
jgi:hypothetical protein